MSASNSRMIRGMIVTTAAVLMGALPARADEAEPAGPKDPAAEIVAASGVKAGLCVHLGCADGKLTGRLARAGNFLVHALATDRAAIERARKYLREQDLYGRVSVGHTSLKELPYADDLVNLIVVEGASDLLAKGLPVAEVVRVLTPGGVACFRVGHRQGVGELKAKLDAAGAGNAAITTPGNSWVRLTKARPGQMDDWTHDRHGPDGNKVSGDLLVGPPARLRWVVGPTWSRAHAHNTLKAMVSAGGRVFYVYDEAPKNVNSPARLSLIARDAYNGLLLWKRAVESRYPPGRNEARHWRFPKSALVATKDRVYAVLAPDGPLTALEAATGKIVGELKDTESPGQVVCHKGLLVLATIRSLAALDAATGKRLWTFQPGARDLAVADGKVFYQAGWGHFGCRDLLTGRPLWQVDTGSWIKSRHRLCFHHAGRLFLGGTAYGRPHAVHALSAADGKHLWSFEPVWGGTDIYMISGLLWLKSTKVEGLEHGAELGLDPATGEVKKRVAFPEYYPSGRGHARCYPNSATERYVLLSSRGTDFVDVRTGAVHDLRAFCGDCGFGVVPANGLLYLAPNSCTCHRYLGGLRALAAAGNDSPARAGTQGAARLEKGPAFDADIVGKGSPDDWPTYRRDDWRGGVAPVSPPAEMTPLWEAAIGGRLSPPTVAAGAVYLASIDAHRVDALDAATGRPRWSYTAGGRVDSPPTVHEGLCLFGSRDGWVYCLRAADGRLLWRFHAAPGARQIVARGQLESAWPVHGSVLVKDGLAYFAAGRAPELDGGVTAYALQPRTGKLIWKVTSPALADVMTAGGRDGRAVCMQYHEFNPKTGQCRRKSTHRYLQAGSGLLDGSYAARRRWSNGVAAGELLVFNAKRTYGFSAFARPGNNAMANPGEGDYRLFCRESTGRRTSEPVWSVPVPLRVTAMVLAGETLLVSGPPDLAPATDPWAAFDGKLGAALWALSADDGEKLSELKLKSVPVFDGMAAAGGRLYLSTADGKLRCLGKK